MKPSKLDSGSVPSFVLAVVLIVLLICVCALVTCLTGCTVKAPNAVFVVQEAPDPAKWVPRSYVDGSPILDGSPVLWLHRNGTANLVAVQMPTYCINTFTHGGGIVGAVSASFVGYNQSYAVGDSLTLVPVWTDLPDSMRLVGGTARCTVVSATEIRGSAYLYIVSPCSPARSDTSSLFFSLTGAD